MIDFGLGVAAGVLLTIAVLAGVAWWVNRNRQRILGWVMHRAVMRSAPPPPVRPLKPHGEPDDYR